MGRRKTNNVHFNCKMNREIKVKLDRLLEDPLRPGKVKHGAMAAYMNKLVAEDLARREALTEEFLKEMQDEYEISIG